MAQVTQTDLLMKELEFKLNSLSAYPLVQPIQEQFNLTLNKMVENIQQQTVSPRSYSSYIQTPTRSAL
jgi:hypothetical protein